MYDAAGRCVQLAENGSTPSYSGNAIKNFLWCGAERCEERDGSNAVVSFFSGLGQKTSGTNEFYSFDHLGSIREVTNGSGTVQSAFDFDPYGNMSVLSGSVKPDFAFTGIYQHSRTNLALTWFRQYNPDFGRWLSRDPVGEVSGLNLYGYTSNDPLSSIDRLGLWELYWPSLGDLIFGYSFYLTAGQSGLTQLNVPLSDTGWGQRNRFDPGIFPGISNFIKCQQNSGQAGSHFFDVTTVQKAKKTSSGYDAYGDITLHFRGTVMVNANGEVRIMGTLSGHDYFDFDWLNRRRSNAVSQLITIGGSVTGTALSVIYPQAIRPASYRVNFIPLNVDFMP